MKKTANGIPTKKRSFSVRFSEFLELMGKRYLAKVERSYGPMARGLHLLSELMNNLSTQRGEKTTKTVRAATLPLKTEAVAVKPAAPTVLLDLNGPAAAKPEQLPEVLSENDWFARFEREKLKALKSAKS